MNDDVVIRVESLGKRYRLGSTVDFNRTLREALMSAPGILARGARRLFGEGERAAEPDTPPGTFWALKDVSFEVTRCSAMGIIGRNGAGKSTLLKVLSRIVTPTAGHAEIQGRVGSLLEVGTGFHPELTGRENIYLSGAILGMRRSEINRKFEEIAAFSEVEPFLDTPVKRYSSGMYVRLAFAVAAHLDPDILIVDEVLAVGDARFQKKCLGKMRDITGEGRTILFVSHNMGAIMDLTQTCLLMEAGKVAVSGKPYEVIGRYLDQGGGASLEADLEKAGRDGSQGEDWRFTQVRILSGRDGKVSYRTPIEVEISYESRKDLEGISIGLVIKDLFGTKLIHIRSTDDGLRFSSAEGESGTLRVCIDHVYVPPGEYVLGMGAVSGSMHSLDVLPDALRFVVESDRDDPEDSWMLGRTSIGARLPSAWALSRR